MVDAADAPPAVVLDPGSHLIRSGFSEDDSPRAVFPPIVGRPKSRKGQEKDTYVGDEAKRWYLRCGRPLEGGLVSNWDDMEKILFHNFYNEMRVAPEEHAFLVSEPVMAPRPQREKFCELAFETFNVPRYATVPNCMLAAFCAGRVEALVVSIGETEGFVCGTSEHTSTADSEGEGFPGCHIVAPPTHLPIQGRNVTKHLAKLLNDRRNYSFTTTGEIEVIEDAKEKRCFVATGDSPAKEETYELPDGQQISLSDERHLAAEALFDPSLMDASGPGVSDAVAEYVTSCCPGELPDRLGSNIVLAGGSTMFPGFAERLQSDLEKRLDSRIVVVAPPERKVS
jgi:actin, other eukaryote